MKLQHLSPKILNTGDTELIKEYIHTFSDFHFFVPFDDSNHPIIPFKCDDEDGTLVLEGEIRSYSDYKNKVDQLIDLKRWEQIESLVFTYKFCRRSYQF